MRLPDEARFRLIARMGGALALSLVLSSCASSPPDFARMAQASQAAQAATPVSGPGADYPQVVGEPFTVDGKLYTPTDTMNYDEVGYAGLDPVGGAGITISHRTLPLPSYVEITALDSGETILARAERRGPMSGTRLAALSSGTAAQLGVAEGAPIRVRRVNPPEAERAELRSGEQVTKRLATPESLAAVLRKRLPARGSASLQSNVTPPVPSSIQVAQNVAPAASAAEATRPTPAAKPAIPPAAVATTPAANVPNAFQRAFAAERSHSAAYPLRPLTSQASASIAPRVARAAAVQTALTTPTPSRAATPAPAQGKFVVQAAAFSNRASADRVAETIDGFVMKAGRYYRVRTGPFVTRGQAEAALAKVQAAGYSDARVFNQG